MGQRVGRHRVASALQQGAWARRTRDVLERTSSAKGQRVAPVHHASSLDRSSWHGHAHDSDQSSDADYVRLPSKSQAPVDVPREEAAPPDRLALPAGRGVKPQGRQTGLGAGRVSHQWSLWRGTDLTPTSRCPLCRFPLWV